jgi:competence protein ComEC
MDFISGNKYLFKGDPGLLQTSLISNFHLKPSRIAHHASAVILMPSLFYGDCWYLFNSSRIIVLQRALQSKRVIKRLSVDILILSKNVKMSIVDIQKLFDCKQIIFDSSNSKSRISKWITECERQKIPCYSVPGKGAFVKTLN